MTNRLQFDAWFASVKDAGADLRWEAWKAATAAKHTALEDEVERLRSLLERQACDLVRADMERAQIVAAERERCARACEDEARLWEADGKGPATEARLCAARIRSLA